MSSAAFGKSKGFVDKPPLSRTNPMAGLPVYDGDAQLIPWGGGVTIMQAGKLVGAVGLSGARGPQKDEDCAAAGAKAVSG